MAAEVRPQIDGIIKARLFQEGSVVRAGQPLYEIDSRLYRATRDQTAAQLANAQAAVVTAQAKVGRYNRLQSADAVARQDVDDAVAAARQASASVAQYRATLASANVTLGFTSGSTAWSATPALSLPVIGGTNSGNLAYSEAQRDYYLATYREAAQTAYREVADGLARAGTLNRQRKAQAELVVAAAKSYAIAEARYREGTDSFLTALVSQRTLYAARQTAISIEAADIGNRITLYQAIGSDSTL